MKLFRTLCSTAAALVLFGTGCTAISSTEGPKSFRGLAIGEGNAKPTSHADIFMDGLYLCGSIPIVTGGFKDGKCSWFHDTVTVDNGVRLVARELRSEEGRRMLDLHTSYGSYPIPILFFLISYRTLHVSANAVK